jgi:hypothetical protein
MQRQKPIRSVCCFRRSPGSMITLKLVFMHRVGEVVRARNGYNVTNILTPIHYLSNVLRRSRFCDRDWRPDFRNRTRSHWRFACLAWLYPLRAGRVWELSSSPALRPARQPARFRSPILAYGGGIFLRRKCKEPHHAQENRS